MVGQRVLCAIHTRPSSGSPEEQVSLQDKCKRNDIFCISTLSYKELRTCTYHFNMAGYWLLPGFCHYPGQIMSKNIRIFFSISAINFKVLFTHTHTHTHKHTHTHTSHLLQTTYHSERKYRTYTGNQQILLKEGISACSFFKILKTKFFLPIHSVHLFLHYY